MMKKAQIKDPISTLPVAGFRKAGVVPDTDSTGRKNPAKSLKGPSTKYGQHNDLKEQNRLLMATNEDLRRQISEMKEHATVLEQRCSNVQEENAEIMVKLQDCHALLIAERLDPVSGGRIGGTAEQTEGQRKELMTISQDLLTALKLFDDSANEHGRNLTEVQDTMKSLRDAREKLCVNWHSFSVDAEEIEKALKEAEQLLME